MLTERRGGTFALRPYRPADHAALRAMYADFEPKRVAQGLPPADEPLRRRWLDAVLAKGDHIVVIVTGEIVGHGLIVPMADGGVELASFLHQSVRGRGIGTALNRALAALARAREARRIWLSVEPWNRAAIRSYQRVGFRHLSDSLWTPEIEMEMPLIDGASGSRRQDA